MATDLRFCSPTIIHPHRRLYSAPLGVKSFLVVCPHINVFLCNTRSDGVYNCMSKSSSSTCTEIPFQVKHFFQTLSLTLSLAVLFSVVEFNYQFVHNSIPWILSFNRLREWWRTFPDHRSDTCPWRIQSKLSTVWKTLPIYSFSSP